MCSDPFHRDYAGPIRNDYFQPIFVALNVEDDRVALQKTRRGISILDSLRCCPHRGFGVAEPTDDPGSCVGVFGAKTVEQLTPDDPHTLDLISGVVVVDYHMVPAVGTSKEVPIYARPERVVLYRLPLV